MNLLVVDTSEIQTAIQLATRDHYTPKFPDLFRSEKTICPSLGWLRFQWLPFWNRHRAARRIKNINNKFCDYIAGHAIDKMNESAGMEAEATGRDATAGIFEARIFIENRFMQIFRGNHSTTLLAYTEDGTAMKLAIWEPQQSPNDPLALIPLEEALESKIVIRDVIL
jgi:hypothetical protein